MESLGDILKRVTASESSMTISGEGEPFPEVDSAGEPCAVCHGLRWVRRHAPLGHADFGELFPCRCQQTAAESQRLERLQRYSGLPEEMLNRMSFDSFDPAGSMYADNQDRATLNAAFTAARSFALNTEGWILLAGPHGCGKTHLAVAIAAEMITRGEIVFFSFVPDLLDHLRSTFRPDNPVDYDQLFEQVKSVPLLILDDLGSESSTAWAQEKLYQIVVSRHNSRLPTIITTYLQMEAIEKAQPRMASRLKDTLMVQWIPISAPDYRDQQRRTSHPRRQHPGP